jgi:preprotein translocase subunit SecD
LTRKIVGEALEVFVGGECVASPIVREPLCGEASFQISANDLAEAEALAQRLRIGWSKAGPKA